MKTCDLFLRSYAGDLAWVPYALRSIHKFGVGIRDIVIVVPANDYHQFKLLNLTKEILASSRVAGPELDDYLGQQIDKLLAPLYTESDLILFWDSDCIAIRTFCPELLMINNKPRWLCTPYSKLVKSDGSQATPWQEVTQKAIGRPVIQYEFMRQHPFLVPREALIEFRQFMDKTHGNMEDYIAKQPHRQFSEWNALASWAYYYRPHLFSFRDTTEYGVPEPFVKQFWSWSGVRDEDRIGIETILA